MSKIPSRYPRRGVTALLLAGAGLAHGQHSVSLSAGVERIENPGLASVSPGGATVLRLAPEYTYEEQDDRSRSRFSVGAVVEQSSNTAVLASREYPNLGYTWAYNWPSAQVEFRTRLAESATRNTEFEEAGRVTVDSRERTVVAGASWAQELTARTRLDTRLEGTRVSYDTMLLEGYRELEASSRVSWEATERVVYFFEPAYARLTPARTGVVSTQTRWLAGVRTDLIPEWSVRVFAGQARVRSDSRMSGSLGGLHLTYSGARLSSDLEWTRDMTASGSSSRYVNTDAVGLRVGYRITEGAKVSASTSRTRSNGPSGSRGTESRLALENELGAHWSSSLGVEGRRSTSASGVSGKGWAVRAGLVYAYPGR